MGIAAPEHTSAKAQGGMDEAERARQVRQAEELLVSGPSREGFAKALFRGEFHAASLFPYPELTSGRTLAAFALTETEAGSDASNVQTTATPSADGKTYILNGTKRWITNGGVAGVLTVMARTPDSKGGESKVTAFLVTPDMP